MSMYARFRGWLLFTTTLLPRKQAYALCFRGQLFFATTTTFLPQKRAYALVFETGCSLSPPPFSLENKCIRLFSGGSCSLPRSFSRLVALYHHHFLPSANIFFQGQLFFATTTSSLKNERVCSFSRLVVLCHHSLENEHMHSFSRVFIFLMYIPLSIIYFSILSSRSGSDIVPFVQVTSINFFSSYIYVFQSIMYIATVLTQAACVNVAVQPDSKSGVRQQQTHASEPNIHAHGLADHKNKNWGDEKQKCQNSHDS